MWRPRLQGSFPTAAIPRRGQDLALFGVGAERFRAGGGAAGAFSRSGPRTRGLPRMPGLPTTPPAVTDRSPLLRVGTAPPGGGGWDGLVVVAVAEGKLPRSSES